MKKKNSPVFENKSLVIWKMAIATALSWELAKFTGSHHPYLAPLTVILCMKPLLDQTILFAFYRFIGTVFGIILVIMVAKSLQLNGLTLGILILSGGFLAKWFKLDMNAIEQVALTILLVFVFEQKSEHYAFDRIKDMLIGAVVAIIVNVYIFPSTFVKRAATAFNEYSSELSTMFSEYSLWILGGCDPVKGNEYKEQLKKAVQELQQMKKDVKKTAKTFVVSTSFFSEKGKAFGDKCPHSIEVNDFIQSGLMTIENLSPAFIHLFKPKPRLILFGAGEDAKPLVHIADYIGFHVILCDWRPSHCNKANFPNAHTIIQGFPQEIYEKIKLTQHDFVVIMSHHFQRDKEFLSLIKNDKLSFLGILGPKKRTVRLLGGGDIPQWISSPVGMDIGSKGAEEIAISIVAEMIKVLRKRTTVWSL